MEIKGVTEDFKERAYAEWTLFDIKDKMGLIETAYEECDELLLSAGMSTLGYESQDYTTMMEHLNILIDYVLDAHARVRSQLDNPLYLAFVNKATQRLSDIVLEEITTENTFAMEEYVEYSDIYDAYAGKEIKVNLTMADFLGLTIIDPGEGMPALENIETIGYFADLFRADYEGLAESDINTMLKEFLYDGEFAHESYHPIKNAVSGILDITIVKPLIECITGKDMLTGDKLTDLEKGMQYVDVLIGLFTLGQGALVADLTGMTGQDAVNQVLKIWAVDAVADVSANMVGYVCDELGLPPGITFIVSLLTGCTVSTGISGYVFTDAGGNVVKELDVDEMQAWLKSMDVDLDDMAWGGGKGTYKAGTDAYESLLGPVSDEELERYMKFLKDGSQAGLTQAELMGIKKVDEYLALSKVDYDEVLALRKGVSEGSSASKVGDFTNLYGSTVDDILDRIPDEATLRELHPVAGGSTEGFEFKWTQDGKTYRVRVHNADPGAPSGSNAANGWIVRVQRGKQYYDYTIDDFQPARYTNPNGDFFDENIMNNTHIPIQDPYEP